MKKLLTVILVVVFVISFSGTAFAAGEAEVAPQVQVTPVPGGPPLVFPKSIKINAVAKTVAPGATLQLKATVQPRDAVSIVTWSSSNDEVASVTQNGLVKGIKPGRVTIAATSYNGLRTVCTVYVGDKLSKIRPRFQTLEIAPGHTAEALVFFTPGSAANKKLFYRSESPGIATVDKNGIITGVSPGTAKIVATSQDGRKKTWLTAQVRERAAQDKVSVTSNGQTYWPEQHYIHSSHWGSNGWVMGDGLGLQPGYHDGVVDEVTLAPDFSVQAAEGMSDGSAQVAAYDGVDNNHTFRWADFNGELTYENLSALPKGKYFVRFYVTENGQYIESEDQYESTTYHYGFKFRI